MKPRLDNVMRIGMISAIVFTCLSHGGVESWSFSIFELMMVGLVLIWTVKIIVEQRLTIRLQAAATPVAFLLAIAIIQSFAFTDSAGHRWSLSMDVEATRTAAMGLFFLLVSFVVAGNFFISKRQLRALVSFLIGFGFVLALFALVQHFTWNGCFYWLRPASAHVTSPFGPFANRNHFAGYMEMLIPLPLALVITRAISKDTRILHLFAAAMMAIAAVATLSRGGMISLIAELIFLILISVRRNDERELSNEGRKYKRLSFLIHSAAIVLFVFITVLAGIGWVGPERVIDRVARTNVVSEDLQAETFFTSRGWVWQDTLTMFRANPIVGVGLGAYETAYPIYSHDDGAATLGTSYLVDRAHNDYLQVLADTGIIGGALALWFFVLLFGAIFRGSKSRDPLLQALSLGGGAGIFGLLVHSLFDFNLQLPSNALLFLLLAAVISHVGTVTAAQKRESFSLRVEPISEFAIITGVE